MKMLMMKKDLSQGKVMGGKRGRFSPPLHSFTRERGRIWTDEVEEVDKRGYEVTRKVH